MDMSTAAVTATPATTTWKIDPTHSHVEFAVRHLMITTVRGRFGALQGSVVTDDADPTRAKVDVVIDAASIDTREPQRDTHLKSADFFEVETYPTITFTSARVQDRQGNTFKLVGDLTMHGVTREVVLDVTEEGRGQDPWGGQRAGYSATTKVKRSDFGLTWNQVLETGGIAVGDEIKISLDLQLVKA
jgi:polyisoprenoid-binding protein YceI